MRKIAVALWLALMVSGQAFALEGPSVTARVLAKSTQSWDGKSLPLYPQTAPEITILRITIPPGVTLPMHQHPVINAGVLLSGELTVYTEDSKTLRLNAGDALVEVVDTWHYGKNEGIQPAEIIVFYAGTPDAPVTLKKDRETISK